MAVNFNAMLNGIFLFFIAACTTSYDVNLQEKNFQLLVNEHFQAPRIVSIDLPANIRSQLYLDTPTIHFKNNGERVNFNMKGRFDIDLASVLLTEPVPITLIGTAKLLFNSTEQAVFLDEIAISSAGMNLGLDVIQPFLDGGIATLIGNRLGLFYLMPVSEESAIGKLMAKGEVSMVIMDGELTLRHKKENTQNTES